MQLLYFSPISKKHLKDLFWGSNNICYLKMFYALSKAYGCYAMYNIYLAKTTRMIRCGS